MRKLFIIAILALLPLSAFAWGVVSISGGVAAPAGGCSTGDVVIGHNTGTTCQQVVEDNIVFVRFQALETCTIDRIRGYKCSAASDTNARFGIYADSSGSPTGSPLASGSNCSVAAGESDETLTSTLDAAVSLTKDAYYWLAVAGDFHISWYESTTTSANCRYQAWTYSATGSLPNVGTLSNWTILINLEGLAQ